MRLTRHQIDVLSFDIARELLRLEAVEADLDALADLLRRAVTDELKVEDDLDLEVHELLKSLAPQMQQGHVDYAKMFEKAKRQLVRERRLIL